MSDEFGPNFITITDEDGNDIELEYVDALEHNGVTYMAFFPTADTEEEAESAQDFGLVILKSVMENGEELLATPDTDEELNEVFDLFTQQLLEDEEKIWQSFPCHSEGAQRPWESALSALIRFKILDFIDLDADCHSQRVRRSCNGSFSPLLKFPDHSAENPFLFPGAYATISLPAASGLRPIPPGGQQSVYPHILL